MKWLAVIGTRMVNDKICSDIEQFVGNKITTGCGIVTGGATGADNEAARLAYELGLDKDRFRIYLPIELKAYSQALLERAKRGKHRIKDVDETVELLELIARERPGVIHDKTKYDKLDTESFHARNQQVVALADELVAFRVNKSAGTSFTIQQAEKKGIPTRVFDY